MKTDSQIRDRLTEILKNIDVPTNKRRDYCEYKGKTGDAFCTITTQKSCKGCSFFSPTMHCRLRVVVEQYDELEASAQESRKMVGQLKNEIANLNAMVAALKYKVEQMSAYQCPDAQRCQPYWTAMYVVEPIKKEKVNGKRTDKTTD